LNHWPNIASIIMLDSQALLTIRTHIVFVMMSGERLGPWASCFVTPKHFF